MQVCGPTQKFSVRLPQKHSIGDLVTGFQRDLLHTIHLVLIHAIARLECSDSFFSRILVLLPSQQVVQHTFTQCVGRNFQRLEAE